MFLRGLVEQRDRDAAELRASLREALRAMPKQLGAGTSPEAREATPTATAMHRRCHGRQTRGNRYQLLMIR